MSETLTSKGGNEDKNHPNRKLRVSLGLVAASSALGGALVGQLTDNDPHARPGISQLRAQEIAQEAVIAQRNAALLADSYTQRLTEQTHPKGKVTPVFMQYLNGKIQAVTPPGAHKGGPPQTYKDAIVLSFANPNQQADKDGKFLIGSWIGIESSSSSGSVVIEPIPYASDSMHFVPNDPNDVKSYIASAGVYPQSYDDGHGQTVGYELIGYDVTGNSQLHNADGSPITPGHIEQG